MIPRRPFPLAALRAARLTTAFALTSLVAAQEPAAPAPADDPDLFELPPFVVQSELLEGYIPTNSVSATRVNAEIRDLPVSIDVVTSQLIKDYGAKNLDEIANLSGGLMAATFPNTFNPQFTLRGFATFTSVRNGFLRAPDVYGSNVQRLEVVRGPSSVLYGLTDPGGAINIITKLPTPDRYVTVETTLGSYDYRLLDVEVNQPVFRDRRVLALVNASILDKGGPRDFEEQVIRFVSGATRVRVTDRLAVTLEAEHRDLEDLPGSYWPRIEDTATQTFKMADMVPRSFNANVPGHYRESVTSLFSVTADWKLGDRWTWRGGANHYSNESDSYYAGSTVLTAARNLSRFMTRNERKTESLNVAQQLLGTWRGEVVDFQAVGGFEFRKGSVEAIDSNLPASLYPPAWDLTNPAGWSYAVPSVDVLTVSASSDASSREAEGFAMGQVMLWGDKVSALGGYRFSDIENTSLNRRNGSRVSSDTTNDSLQLGVMLRPVKALGIYVNYAESFRFISNLLRRNADRSLSPYDPIQGVGTELGVKFEAFDRRLNLNLAAYEIEQQGVRRVVTMRDSLGTYDVDTQSGVERSRGIDFTATWNVTKQWQVVGSLVYSDAITVSNEQNRAFEGRVLPDAPEWMGQLTTRYRFPSGLLKGVEVGGTAKAVDTRLAFSTLNPFFLDEYVVVNGFAQYRHQLTAKIPVIFRVNLTNVFDEFYFPDTGGPGMPRSIRFSVETKF